MAERKIRCLNNQVKAIRCKSLNCKPKQWNEYDSDDDDMYHFEQSLARESRGRKSMDLIAAEKGWISPMSKSKRSNSQPPSNLVCSRCQTRDRGAFRATMDDSLLQQQTGSTKKSSKGSKEYEKISAKELLGASLYSLEQLHRQRTKGNGQDTTAAGGHDDPYPHSIMEDSYGTPSAEYLKGAIWLGRNIHMITEEMVEQLDSFRTKYLREISALSRNDSNQSPAGTSTSHRLSLLAASGITDTMTIAYNARTKSRKMLQQASSLVPGDAEGLQKFLLDLPIESILKKGIDDVY